MPVTRFTRSAVDAEGIQYDGTNIDELKEFVGKDLHVAGGPGIGRGYDVYLQMAGKGGRVPLNKGDWILKHAYGIVEFFVMSDYNVKTTYTQAAS